MASNQKPHKKGIVASPTKGTALQRPMAWLFTWRAWQGPSYPFMPVTSSPAHSSVPSSSKMPSAFAVGDESRVSFVCTAAADCCSSARRLCASSWCSFTSTPSTRPKPPCGNPASWGSWADVAYTWKGTQGLRHPFRGQQHFSFDALVIELSHELAPLHELLLSIRCDSLYRLLV